MGSTFTKLFYNNDIPNYQQLCEDQDFLTLVDLKDLYNCILQSDYPLYNDYAILTKVLFLPFTFGKLIYSDKQYKLPKFNIYILTLDDIYLIEAVKNGPMQRSNYDYFINPQYIVMNMTLLKPLIDVCYLLQTNNTLTYHQLTLLIDDKLKMFDHTSNDNYSQVITIKQLNTILKTEKLL